MLDSDDDDGESATDPARTFRVDVFDQAEWWITPSGRRVAVNDLDATIRLELARWLFEHARYFYLAVLRVELVRFALREASADERNWTEGVGTGNSPGPSRWRRGRSRWRAWATRLSPPFGDTPSVTIANDFAAGLMPAGIEGMPELVFESAETWMEATLLYRALSES
jgi:hypothetical protein